MSFTALKCKALCAQKICLRSSSAKEVVLMLKTFRAPFNFALILRFRQGFNHSIYLNTTFLALEGKIY